MDEADVRQKARAFVAKVDMSGIREDLTPYVVAANAKVMKDELGEGESGYTITKPNGKHVITVNSLETDPDGHPKLLHFWPVKLLQAGRSDGNYTGATAMREAASFNR